MAHLIPTGNRWIVGLVRCGPSAEWQCDSREDTRMLGGRDAPTPGLPMLQPLPFIGAVKSISRLHRWVQVLVCD